MAVAFCFKFACRAAHTLKVLHASACNNQKKKKQTQAHMQTVLHATKTTVNILVCI